MDKKNQEVFIFTDFNNTLVDFENEYDSMSTVNEIERFECAVSRVKAELTKCLKTFERKTGLTPVISVITNASLVLIDGNGVQGIHQDLRMTFFNHINQSPEQARQLYENNCEKYFRYLTYRENDFYFKINPLASSLDEMFEPHIFDEKALSISYNPSFKKRESVERLMTILDPDGTRCRFCIYAGDSIKDDYPMKLMVSSEGLCKIFIRPGRVQKLKPSIKYEFCVAKGLEFKSVHPNTGKKIKCFDENTIKLLSEEEQAQIENFDDGDYVLLTNRNSRGFIEGLYQSIDIINSVKQSKQNQMQ